MKSNHDLFTESLDIDYILTNWKSPDRPDGPVRCIKAVSRGACTSSGIRVESQFAIGNSTGIYFLKSSYTRTNTRKKNL